jgi:hypothetical protein
MSKKLHPSYEYGNEAGKKDDDEKTSELSFGCNDGVRKNENEK